MKKREFLTDVNIWGALLVARCGDILHHSIPCLLKYCDKILLMQDNIDEYTQKIVEDYKRKYPDRIELSETGFPRATPEQEKSVKGLFHRFKPLQGPIREKVFEYMRERNKEKKVDILIFPDSDEIFSDSFKELLIVFWSRPEIKGLTMKPVDVFGDMNTIHSRSMTGHTRCLKFFPELTAIPYRTACYYRPLTKTNRMGSNRVLIHLASLTLKKREWRNKHWKPNARNSEALWKLPREITKMDPNELREILLREPDMTVEEYLRGGDKRVPVGITNAGKALREASEMLDEMCIRNFLAFGTCLGIYRDGGLIKWDWDVDLIVLGEDLDNFDKDKVIEKGFADLKIKRDIPKWKKGKEESKELYIRTISFKKHGVRVDVDPAYMSADGKSRLILKGRKREKFCAKHPSEWFEPLPQIDIDGKRRSIQSIVDYEGKEYNVPTQIEEYLKSNYGNNWNTPSYGPTPWSNRSCMSQNYECA